MFELAAALDVGDDVGHEVLITVADRGVFDRFGFVLAGPDGLACGPVAVEAGAARGDPIAQPLPGVREIPVPADRC